MPLTPSRELRRLYSREDLDSMIVLMGRDATVIAALYRYGVLHRAVRAHLAGVDRVLEVSSWAEPG